MLKINKENKYINRIFILFPRTWIYCVIYTSCSRCISFCYSIRNTITDQRLVNFLNMPKCVGFVSLTTVFCCRANLFLIFSMFSSLSLDKNEYKIVRSGIKFSKILEWNKYLLTFHSPHFLGAVAVNGHQTFHILSLKRIDAIHTVMSLLQNVFLSVIYNFIERSHVFISIYYLIAHTRNTLAKSSADARYCRFSIGDSHYCEQGYNGRPHCWSVSLNVVSKVN